METNVFMEFINVLKTDAGPQIIRHLQLVFTSVFTAIIIALPAGIVLTRPRFKAWSSKILAFFNVAQGLPSLAVVAIFLPIMGIGFLPSIIALTVYALLPILRNTIAGINSIDPDIIEAARGMGMPGKKVLLSIELPLALPVITAGIQTSAVVTVGTAVIADLIGGGGLGRLIFTGISMFDPVKILAGSVLAALIAIALDQSFDLIHKRVLTPYKGVKQ